MKHHLLTEVRIRKLIADKAVGYHLDGAGLYLQISRYLSRNWIFRYAFGGRTRDMGLGSYPTVPLSAARKPALEQREHLIRGNDPLELRQAKKDQLRSEALESVLFRDAAKAYLEIYSPTWKNAKHPQQWRNTLDTYAMRSLGSLRVLSITGSHITDALAPIWQVKRETASRVKQRVERIIEWVKNGRPKRLAFIRAAGMTHVLAFKSISSHLPPITSPVRKAVRMVTSRAR